MLILKLKILNQNHLHYRHTLFVIQIKRAYLSICTLIYKITLHPTFNKDTHTQTSNNKSSHQNCIVLQLIKEEGDGEEIYNVHLRSLFFLKI